MGLRTENEPPYPQTQAELENYCNRLITSLRKHLGDRLACVLLCGSWARGEAKPPDSDVDLAVVIDTAHSRFPVYEGTRDNIIGILLAKDLLRYYADPEEFNIRDMLRPAVFIPESKRLNVLLKEFRSNRNHMAIVVNEYGGVAGLVTIEDVLEQIVGEIEDEYDFDDEEANIVMESDGTYRVKAITEIDNFNEILDTHFDNDDFDTIGGLVLNKFGRVPARHESVVIRQFKFTVQRADSRRLYMLKVEKLEPAVETPTE